MKAICFDDVGCVLASIRLRPLVPGVTQLDERLRQERSPFMFCVALQYTHEPLHAVSPPGLRRLCSATNASLTGHSAAAAAR